jgi:hypothetical protein
VLGREANDLERARHAADDAAAGRLLADERRSRRRGPRRGPRLRTVGAAQPARHPLARARQPAADGLAIVRDQPGKLAERHLSGVMEREQIARLVVEVVQSPAQQ